MCHPPNKTPDVGTAEWAVNFHATYTCTFDHDPSIGNVCFKVVLWKKKVVLAVGAGEDPRTPREKPYDTIEYFKANTGWVCCERKKPMVGEK